MSDQDDGSGRNLLSYFRVKPVGSRAEIGATLWSDVSADEYSDEPARSYQKAIFDQYALYVEMADRVSQRRSFANTFFLSLNTGIFVLGAGYIEAQTSPPKPMVATAAVALIVQCLTWFWILRSYRQLNSAKFAVIGELEKLLPAKPYSDAEWAAVGYGRDPARYWPLTRVETVVPILFGAAYLVIALSLLFS